MALGEQADHQLLDHVLLADDHPLDLGDRLPEHLGRLLVAQLPRRRAAWLVEPYAGLLTDLPHADGPSLDAGRCLRRHGVRTAVGPVRVLPAQRCSSQCSGPHAAVRRALADRALGARPRSGICPSPGRTKRLVWQRRTFSQTQGPRVLAATRASTGCARRRGRHRAPLDFPCSAPCGWSAPLAGAGRWRRCRRLSRPAALPTGPGHPVAAERPGPSPRTSRSARCCPTTRPGSVTSGSTPGSARPRPGSPSPPTTSRTRR